MINLATYFVLWPFGNRINHRCRLCRRIQQDLAQRVPPHRGLQQPELGSVAVPDRPVAGEMMEEVMDDLREDDAGALIRAIGPGPTSCWRCRPTGW